MKKFLSLVLALVMTMSLVTIGAGATEYKDLSDKGEIQYEEAVAVLNKLGIITGYEDGSFKPTGALTRGAAAKIIVSLMIGSEAASNLTVAAAPYKDVATTNTFAAVISYCKTAGYINGYADGTFRPTASLTGYAFSKMLLGALGYDGVQEGFTGSGWTMNVAKLGNTSGLFNDFATAFSGNAGVTREQACLLALNTLKATEVQYAGGTNITTTTGNATTNVSTQKERSYVTSNNSKINANIKGQDQGNNSAYLTLQFGEEHFADLKLTADGTAADDFGRPSNQWSYKSVKIGTYAQTADKTYTTEASGDTAADKVKDMGLKDYKVSKSYYYVNGKEVNFTANTDEGKLKEIADLTANGVLVEAYMDDDNANTVSTFVLVYTQIMKVNTVKSTEVTLKTVEDTYLSTSVKAGYPVVSSVTSVKDDDDAWSAVKDLKADAYVLIVPVKDGSSYRVFSAAVPQTATGSLTNIKVKTNNTTVSGITVAGTAYKMSKLWASEDGELTGSTKISSSTESTIYLDTYGNAIYVANVTASNSAIIIDEIYSSVVDGKIVKTAKGWDSNGNELSLNLGTNPTYPVGDETAQQGKVYEYETSTSNNADYKLLANTTTLTANKNVHVYAAASTANKYVLSGASAALIGSSQTKVYFDANVKFIFVTKNDDGDVTGISVNNGVTEVGSSTDTSKQYNLSYIMNKDGDKIIAVVIPNDDDAANTANLLYFQKVTNHVNSADGKRVAMFTAYINGEKVTDCQLSKDVTDTSYNNCFFTYSKDEATGVYTLSKYTKVNKATSVYSSDSLTAGDILSDTYFISSTSVNGGATGAELNAKNAQVIDLYTDDGVTYSTLKEMKDALTAGTVSGFTVSYIYNGSDNSGSGTVSYMFITANTAGSGSGSSTTAAPAGTATVSSGAYLSATSAVVYVNATRASFVPTAAELTVSFNLLANGVKVATGTATVGASENTGRAVVTGITGGILTSDTLTAEVTNVTTNKVNVNYVDANDNAVTVYTDSACTTVAPTMISTTGNAAALTFYVKTSDTTTALTATVTNDTTTTKGVAAGAAAYTAATNKFVVDTRTDTPAGTSAVTVKISGLNNLVSSYTVTYPAAATLAALGYTSAAADYSTTKGFTLTLSGRTTVTSTNNTVGVTATLTGGTLPATHGLQVVVSDGTSNHTIYIANGQTTGSVNITVSKTSTLSVVSVSDVAVPVVTRAYITDVDGNGAWTDGKDTITVVFAAPVDMTAAPTAAAALAVGTGTWNADKTAVTYVVTAKPDGADRTLTISAADAKDATTKCILAADAVITVPFAFTTSNLTIA